MTEKELDKHVDKYVVIRRTIKGFKPHDFHKLYNVQDSETKAMIVMICFRCQKKDKSCLNVRYLQMSKNDSVATQRGTRTPHLF